MSQEWGSGYENDLFIYYTATRGQWKSTPREHFTLSTTITETPHEEISSGRTAA